MGPERTEGAAVSVDEMVRRENDLLRMLRSRGLGRLESIVKLEQTVDWSRYGSRRNA